MRIRPLTALSVAALSALLLAGCAAGEPDNAASPTGSAVDLCGVVAPSGEASDAVTVEGTVGEESTATFTFPLEVPALEVSVIEEGDGDPIEAGQLVNFALSGFDASTGAKFGSIGYPDTAVLPQQVSPDSPLGQIVGCATTGTRVVATLPATDQAAAQVYIVDVLSVVPNAAWGEEQEPVDGLPTVALADDGAPTIELPDGDAPTELELEVLKKGDGATVAPGDNVLVQYTGMKWSDGSVFDSTWEKGGVPTSFQTTGVVDGFRQALEGQTVGSQVIVVIPPALGYGEGELNATDLKGETLVFVVDILGTETAPAAPPQ